MSFIDEKLLRVIVNAIAVSLITIILICNVIVYREVHHHEKQIAAQQVDVVRSDQAPVVQTLDSAIHWINHDPADNAIVSRNTYPLDSDLSGG